MIANALGTARVGEIAFQVLHQIQSAIESARVDAAGKLRIGRHAIGILHRIRGEVHAQESRALALESVTDVDKMR